MDNGDNRVIKLVTSRKAIMAELLGDVDFCSILDIKQEKHLAENDCLELGFYQEQLGDSLQLCDQEETHILTLNFRALDLVTHPFLMRHCFVHVLVVDTDILK